MPANQNLEISKEKIAEFCKMNHIRKLSLFGSSVRHDFRSDSDVDILVEFKPCPSHRDQIRRPSAIERAMEIPAEEERLFPKDKLFQASGNCN